MRSINICIISDIYCMSSCNFLNSVQSDCERLWNYEWNRRSRTGNSQVSLDFVGKLGVGVRQKLAACMQESSCLCIIVRFHCCNASQLGVYIFTGKLGRNSFSSVCIRFHVAPIYCGFILRPNLLSGSFNKTFVATNSTICCVTLFVKVSRCFFFCFFFI